MLLRPLEDSVEVGRAPCKVVSEVLEPRRWGFGIERHLPPQDAFLAVEVSLAAVIPSTIVHASESFSPHLLAAPATKCRGRLSTWHAFLPVAIHGQQCHVPSLLRLRHPLRHPRIT